MKKLTALLLAFACALTVTACGSGKETPAPAVPQPEPSYHHSVVEELVNAGAFSEELEELDIDTAYMLYKLADYDIPREELREAWVLRSAGATCEEVALLAFLHETDELMSKAEQAMKDYIQSQIDSNVDYRPNEIPKLEEAVVSRSGWTVLMLVANDYEAAKPFLK